ncbi:MAG: hypothetical protein AAF907_15535, partial [Planctomycetota bacterium]
MTVDAPTMPTSARSPGERTDVRRPHAALPAGALDRHAALAPAAAFARAVGAGDDPHDRRRFAGRALAEIATAVGARGGALIGPPPHFDAVTTWGESGDRPPRETLADCLDRDVARLVADAHSGGRLTMVLPGGHPALPIVTLSGRGLAPTDLRGAWAAVGCLAAALPGMNAAGEAAERAERFERLAAVAADLAAVKQSGPLLEALASAACELLGCDRASIFLHLPDPASDEEGGRRGPGRLVGRPALGVEGGELEIPADAGV